MKIKFFPLKIIKNPKGNILHALKKSDKDFENFGEAYFSEINYREIKAWKYHNEMKMNFFVPFGAIKFVFFINNEYQEFIISKENYGRISVDPKVWFGFQGLHNPYSLLLNVASIEHNQDEVETKELNKLKYNWN